MLGHFINRQADVLAKLPQPGGEVTNSMGQKVVCTGQGVPSMKHCYGLMTPFASRHPRRGVPPLGSNWGRRTSSTESNVLDRPVLWPTPGPRRIRILGGDLTHSMVRRCVLASHQLGVVHVGMTGCTGLAHPNGWDEGVR